MYIHVHIVHEEKPARVEATVKSDPPHSMLEHQGNDDYILQLGQRYMRKYCVAGEKARI